ncbi:MAG: hypothetical protein AAF632_04970 [Bacteroidota bacterium]
MNLRITLVLILYFLFSNETEAQLTDFEFDPTDLKGYTEVVSQKQAFDMNDTSYYTTVYSINNNGYIVGSRSYSAGELKDSTTFAYNSAGQLVREKKYSPVYQWNPDTNEQITIWDHKNIHMTNFIYSDGKLVEEQRSYSYLGKTTIDQINKHFCNDAGREIRTEFINTFIGVTGSFKPNSMILDNLYNKHENELSFVTKNYKQDSVIITHYDTAKEIEGYTYYVLNEKDNPILESHADSAGITYLMYQYEYNQEGRLLKSTRKMYDDSRIIRDTAVSDIVVYKYQDAGLLETVISYSEGQISSITKYKFIE